MQFCRDSVIQISGFRRIGVGVGVFIPVSKQPSVFFFQAEDGIRDGH
jgi:hypothetical protein